MVKKHQPSNETCIGSLGGGRCGWALFASPALSKTVGWQARCVRGDAQTARISCAAVDYRTVKGFPATPSLCAARGCFQLRRIACCPRRSKHVEIGASRDSCPSSHRRRVGNSMRFHLHRQQVLAVMCKFVNGLMDICQGRVFLGLLEAGVGLGLPALGQFL